jgi:hypothetical protein
VLEIREDAVKRTFTIEELGVTLHDKDGDTYMHDYAWNRFSQNEAREWEDAAAHKELRELLKQHFKESERGVFGGIGCYVTVSKSHASYYFNGKHDSGGPSVLLPKIKELLHEIKTAMPAWHCREEG